MPKGGIESCAFLSFFLPSLEISRKVSEAFKSNGIDVCWNYFDNNWHYIREWHHLKDAKSLYPLSSEIKNALEELKTQNFSQSDFYIGRNISCLIKLSWTEEEVRERALKMRNCINEVLMVN
mgnify:FL=1